MGKKFYFHDMVAFRYRTDGLVLLGEIFKDLERLLDCSPSKKVITYTVEFGRFKTLLLQEQWIECIVDRFSDRFDVMFSKEPITNNTIIHLIRRWNS